MPEYALLICDDVPQDIVLLDAGPHPLEVVKALREIFGGGLSRAQQTVKQTPPVLLAERVGEEAVTKWVGRLRDSGAVVEVRTSAS
jgi:large subunit ribosomal protein L7/L12